MGHSLLASLGHGPGTSSTGDMLDTQCITSAIVGLANDIQAILGDALTTATTMFPHKPPATPGKGILPRHFGPNRFGTMFPTFGAVPSPSTASSTMRRKHKGALHRRHSQGILLCRVGAASISRYHSAYSLTLLPRTWTLWGSSTDWTPLPWTQLPYRQRTSALRD